MFHIEKMQAKDFPFAVKLANTMGWSTSTEDFNFNAKLEPDGCFLLFDEQERVGIATCISYGRVGWFGNLVVTESYRKKGAGTLIVKHTINYLKNRGVEIIGLYTYPHLLNFYSRFGFRQKDEVLVLNAKTVSPMNGEKMKKAHKEDLAAIVELDKRCYGASRKKLLQQIISNEDNLFYVSIEEGEVVAYAVSKISGGLAEIGPLICNRNNSQTGVDLVECILSKLEGTEAFMYVPTLEKNLLDIAIKAGFQEHSRLKRMFLGSHSAEEYVYLAESLERG